MYNNDLRQSETSYFFYFVTFSCLNERCLSENEKKGKFSLEVFGKRRNWFETLATQDQILVG